MCIYIYIYISIYTYVYTYIYIYRHPHNSTGVCKRKTPPKKKTRERISFENTKSGAGEQSTERCLNKMKLAQQDVPVSLKADTPRENNTHWNVSFQSTTSGAGDYYCYYYYY